VTITPDELLDEDLTDGAKALLRPLYERYLKRAQEVWCGRNRAVFDMGSYVVKLPRNSQGFGDNDWEGSISNGPDSDPAEDIQYARTRMFYVKLPEHDYIPILFMEKVVYAERQEHLPDWVMSVDCGQVGWSKNGKLVAFDYGYN
jgi:hypothetical protein